MAQTQTQAPLWASSAWDRPLSPKSGRKYQRHSVGLSSPLSSPSSASRPQQQPQQQAARDSFDASALAQAVVRLHVVHPHAEQQQPATGGPGGGPQEGGGGLAAGPESSGGAAADGTAAASQHRAQAPGQLPSGPSMTVHYVGLAKGELGVLSKRQAIGTRPATAPNARRPRSPAGAAARNDGGGAGPSAASHPWGPPMYCLQEGHPVPPPKPGVGQQLCHVVDDPVGQRRVAHNHFNSKALHPTVPPREAQHVPRNTRWMRAPPADAPLTNKDLTTSWRPRLLSAGGFPGWKLSKRLPSGAQVAKPVIPPALLLRPTTSPATLHVSPMSPPTGTGALPGSLVEADAFPPPPAGAAADEGLAETPRDAPLGRSEAAESEATGGAGNPGVADDGGGEAPPQQQ